MSKQAVIDELVKARNELYKALRSVPEARFREAGTVEQGSIADLCGHISSWENRLLTLIQQISQGDEERAEGADFAGRPEGFCDDPVYNDAQLRKRRRWPWREILNELVWMREETGWTLANMSEATFFRQQAVETDDRGIIHLSPADIVRQLTAHDRQHATEIEDWKACNEL